MKNKVILDASALLALLQGEKGGELIKPFLNEALMSSVNIAESLTVLQKNSIPLNVAIGNITTIIRTIIPFDVEQAQMVAELYSVTKHKGLSLGDRACLALGIELQLPIYTADKIWKELNIDKANIRLIR